MQTQSIQSQQPNKPQPSKSASLPSNDFQNALALEIDRQPVCAAPEQQPSPAQAHARQSRTTQAAKPVQQAQGASQAERAEASANAAASDGKPVSAEAAPAGDAKAAADDATDTAATDTVPAADPAAGMLAMLAAYGQLATKVEAKAELPETPLDTDAAALAALQTDKASKATLADLAADARAGKAQAGGTSALQDAGEDRLLKTGGGLSTDAKTEAFDAQLAANLADAAPVAQPVPPAAQAMAASVQAANAVAANQLQARVGSNAWEQQLGQKVVWMVAGGDQSASLTLNPPDLGPLQVVLSVSNDSATATFTAHQPETRQAIENALPKLREMMSEAGITLGDASVSAGSQEQQQAFAEQARGSRGGGRYGDGGDADAAEEAQPVIRRTVLGAVDTFA
ncbi:flagellar hook-length control protein FliK [Pseudoduganella lutea]|nr:flagellar hook-length control protein FliK [Pseudoduganella lutea]